MSEKSYSWFFGPFLAAVRHIMCGLSQEELEKVTDIPKGKISRVERQIQPVTFDDFMSLSTVCGDGRVDLLDLFISYVVEARQALHELEEQGRMDDRIARAVLDSIADKILSEESDKILSEELGQ